MSNIPTISSITRSNSINSTYIIGKNSSVSTDKIIYTITGTNLINIIEIVYTPKNPNEPFIYWNGPPYPVQNSISDVDQSDWSYENGDGTSIMFTITPKIGGPYYIQINSNGNYSLPYYYEFPYIPPLKLIL